MVRGSSRLYVILLCSLISNACIHLFSSMKYVSDLSLLHSPDILMQQTLIDGEPTGVKTSSFLKSVEISPETLEKRLPPWMMEYFRWHQEQLRGLNKTNWKSSQYRFLILRCSKLDKACGGTADRLKVLPWYLRTAYDSRRIFLIRWEQPYPLEEFLQPTSHFNWTVPGFLEKRLNSDHPYGGTKKDPKRYQFHRGNAVYNASIDKDGPIILESRRQIDDGGEALYRALTAKEGKGSDRSSISNNTYAAIFHYVFWAVFQPSTAIASLIDHQLHQLGLVPGLYSAAHSRNFYKRPMSKVSKRLQQKNAINAVKCASQLHSGDPIYFASDSTASVQAVQNYAMANQLPIHTPIIGQTVTIPNTDTTMPSGEIVVENGDPLHLDFAGRGNRTWPVSAYYDTFVDLLMLGSARCISYGEGGYGIFASLLSYEPTCTSVHTVANSKWLPKALPCEWKKPQA